MSIEAIRSKTPRQVRAAVSGFSVRYIQDWTAWLATPQPARPQLFGRILRRWQATRPLPMRRLKNEARHEPPFLDDLLEAAERPVSVLKDVTVLTIADKSREQGEALKALWEGFSRLPISGLGSCVGITKAVLLLTDGRIGPALDSQVRMRLGVARPATCKEWLQILEHVAEDIAGFESIHGPLDTVVPSRFAHLAYGRLYDMALGPR